MKILFTHSYFLNFDPKQRELAQPYPPLGTIYAASVMREQGYDVSLFDTMFVTDPGEVAGKIDALQPRYFVVYDDGFNYLTKMCLTNMRDAAVKMIGIAKNKGCTVIVSSSDSTDHYDQYLDAGADYIMIGEAEMTLVELTDACEQHPANIVRTQGLVLRCNGNLVKTPPRSVLKHLDGLPTPAWDLVDMGAYKSMWLKSTGYFSLNMATTRGCPFKCNWCAKPIYGNRYNSRSPDHVVQELRFLKEKYQFDHIWFCDDIFGLKPGWVHEFAELAHREGLSFNYKIQSRADLLLQEDTVADLARSGCDNVWIGAESGSQKILDAMDKGITIEQIAEATRLLKKNGIRPSFFIQFGYLGETREDIQKTIKMIRNLLPASIGVSVSYPLPGTVFYEKVKTHLQYKSNWTDSDELQLMFKNTYQPAFYKQLHRYAQKTHLKYVAIDHLKRIFKNPVALSATSIRKAASLIYYIPAVFITKLKLNTLEKTL